LSGKCKGRKYHEYQTHNEKLALKINISGALAELFSDLIVMK
jgi:hypothetical protein